VSGWFSSLPVAVALSVLAQGGQVHFASGLVSVRRHTRTFQLQGQARVHGLRRLRADAPEQAPFNPGVRSLVSSVGSSIHVWDMSRSQPSGSARWEQRNRIPGLSL